MPVPEKFKAMIVREAAENRFVREIGEKSIAELPPGELLIRVRYSSLNYKDALSASGHRGVTRSYPHTPGIDAAGVVAESESENFFPGDEVILTGFDLGANTSGGFAEYVRVPAAWALKLPPRMTLAESMSYGTAGLTAAIAIWKLERYGLGRDDGEVLVTGATGGVGSLAVAILAKLGYHVVAATGKTQEKDFLLGLGAKEVISRGEASDTSGRPLLKARWAGVVDTVGGNILSTAIRSTRSRGGVAACGNVASAELQLTIYPFILRGVGLLGIDSAECPMELREALWQKLAGEWKVDLSRGLVSECRLEDLSDKIDLILAGRIRGRVLVNLG